jgi:hypothetical protein
LASGVLLLKLFQASDVGFAPLLKVGVQRLVNQALEGWPVRAELSR